MKKSLLFGVDRSAGYLEEPDEQHGEADGLHDAGVVVQQGLLAASPPQVQLLAPLVVVRMRSGVAQVVLDAGSGRQGAAAAEGNAVHQVLPLHVTAHTAAENTEAFLLQFTVASLHCSCFVCHLPNIPSGVEG